MNLIIMDKHVFMFEIKRPHTQNLSVYNNFTFSTNVAFIDY